MKSKRLKPDQFPLRFPDNDSLLKVSRDTLNRVATQLGLNETQTVHYALRRLADDLLPRYEKDDEPLTPEQLTAIRAMESQDIEEPSISSLF